MLTDLEAQIARERTYALLSQLFASGVSPANWPALRAIPELAAHLPHVLDTDEAAAAHYHTFSDTVLPFESVFRDPSGLIGGEVSTAVAARYEAAGYSWAEEADSISAELGFLSYLLAAERHALDLGDPAAAGKWRAEQRGFLDEHVLGWLPPLAAALADGRWQLYTAVSGLALLLLAEHRAALGDMVQEPPPLPATPDLLQREDTSLRQISILLLTPPYSGFFLSRDSISALARARRLPRGFGLRQQMLRNLLETAGQYGSEALVLGDLLAFTARVSERYEAQASGVALLARWVRPWQERLARTTALLAEMRRLVS